MWGGEHRPHSHRSAKNLANAVLCATAAAPSWAWVSQAFHAGDAPPPGAPTEWTSPTCLVLTLHPVLAVNLLFFLNVTVGFWVVGLLQRSFWLIDPYWTLVPVLIAGFYRSHPASLVSQLGVESSQRATVGFGLVCVWSLRLTHSYFRRENWKFGEREDWRYTKMAKENPSSWVWKSFFAVGLAQQPMLVGVCLPLYAMNFVEKEWGVADTLWTCLCMVGIWVAWRADNELFEYTQNNARLGAANRPKEKLLRTGLWKYSRHPNYFGEQLFWWSLAMFSVSLGQWWHLVGTAFNSIVLGAVTVMTEEKMIKGWDKDRVELYQKYRKTTSVCIPLPTSWDKEK